MGQWTNTINPGLLLARQIPLSHCPPILRVGIVGSGVMAEAIISCVLDHALLQGTQIVCSHPRNERMEELSDRYGVQTVASNVQAVADADIVLIAVKPQTLHHLMAELSGNLRDTQTVISVVAGASTAILSKGLSHTAVVRCMPNTPAQIGKGVTVWYATADVKAAARLHTQMLLATLGHELEVDDERLVSMATAISGTGPTYLFLFLEALTDAAVHLGFPRRVARQLVLETVEGSAAFARGSNRHFAELRDMVTSPGGTSAAALYELERGQLRTVLSDAVRAAYDRTLELESALEHQVSPS